LIAVLAASTVFGIGVMVTHQVAYIQDLGFSPMTAAMTMSIISAVSIIGGLGFGVLALRFNLRYLASAFFIIRLVALGILLSSENIALIYTYTIFFGISSGALGPAVPTLVGTYYGRARYAQVLGVVITIRVIAQAAGPAIAGVIYDVTDKYTLAFVLVAAFTLLGLICALLARPPELSQMSS
jgi:MFS family permease